MYKGTPDQLICQSALASTFFIVWFVGVAVILVADAFSSLNSPVLMIETTNKPPYINIKFNNIIERIVNFVKFILKNKKHS